MLLLSGLSDTTMAEQDLLALIKRLETVAAKLEKSAPGSASLGKLKHIKFQDLLHPFYQNFSLFVKRATFVFRSTFSVAIAFMAFSNDYDCCEKYT